MEQPQYNLLHRERVELEYAPLYAELGLGTTTFSPLASGLLTGKYASGAGEEARLDREGMGWLKRIVVGDSEAHRIERSARFAAAAREMGQVPATLAIAWCLRNPHVSSVILGASRVEQLLQNLEALQLFEALGEDEWARVEAAVA
jgi:aryl-alcohol dehydrogenase-like predicted oxidoreductase